MGDKLGDEAQRLLDGDAANHVDNVRVVPFSNLLHHLNLAEKV